MPQTLRFALFLIAVLSPLCTFASLWQIKEWRIDRAREHLRAEGWLRQLLGLTRPAIIAGAFVVAIGTSYETVAWDAALSILALASVTQIALRRQRFPVWTKKAIALTGTAFTLNLLTAVILSAVMSPPLGWLFPVLTLLQPDFLFFGWLLFLPLDTFLKRRVMRRAGALRSQYANATVIGITGSVGKTTTKELITHALKGRNILSTPAYVNSEMGVSQWLLTELPKYPTDAELLVIVEMGAYRTGEIRTLCGITAPQMGVITFIGSQHIALFGSKERLCKAKGELLQSLPPHGHAFLNGDNALCASLRDRCLCPVTTVGTGGHADIEAFDIEETGDGIRFRVGEIPFALPLHGTHNVTNALLSIAVAEKLGMKRSDCAAKLRTFRPPFNTFTVRTERGITILDDTHNASPESFRACIAWAKSQPMERKILITPGVIELGSEEEHIHSELGAQAAGIFSRVVFIGKHGSLMFAEGFGKPVELLKRDTVPSETGDLLVCVGRMSAQTIDRLLP